MRVETFLLGQNVHHGVEEKKTPKNLKQSNENLDQIQFLRLEIAKRNFASVLQRVITFGLRSSWIRTFRA